MCHSFHLRWQRAAADKAAAGPSAAPATPTQAAGYTKAQAAAMAAANCRAAVLRDRKFRAEYVGPTDGPKH
eukprot:10604690-Heterocapsa_arctica.AAC.1